MYDVRGKNSAGTIANPASGTNAQTYVVRKLADGNCWMVQNLNLNLSTSVSLNSTTSDLTEGRTWTPQYSTQTTDGIGWAQNGGNVARSYDPGENIYFTNGVGTGTLNTTTHNYSSYATSGDPWYHAGNYYNWYAATAGTGLAAMVEGDIASDSICSKNWKLPSNDGSKSFINLLFIAYGLANDAPSHSKSLASPLNLVRSGDYDWNAATVYARGYSGYWWSTAAYDTLRVHALGATATESVSLRPQYGYGKGYGFSIRCVAR